MRWNLLSQASTAFSQITGCLRLTRVGTEALRGPESVLYREGILFVKLFLVELTAVFVDELGQGGVEGYR